MEFQLPRRRTLSRFLTAVAAVIVCFVGRADQPGVGAVDASCATCSGGVAGFGVNLTVSMGERETGQSAGDFFVAANLPRRDLASVDLLGYTVGDGTVASVEVVRDPQTRIRQVVSLQAIADIVTFTDAGTPYDYAYEVRIYKVAAKGTLSGGVYPILNPTANWVATWRVENPDVTGSTYHQLKVTESNSDGALRVWNYSFDTANNEWTLTQPAQLGATKRKYSFNTAGDERTDMHTVLAGDGVTVVRYSEKKYRKLSTWGWFIAAENEGVAGNDRETTTYEYYASPNFTPTADRPPLYQVLHPDGTWERYVYDASGRILQTFSGVGIQGPTSDPALCRLVENSYTPLPSNEGDNATVSPDSPRIVTEKVNNVVVAKTYYSFNTAFRKVVVVKDLSLTHPNNFELVTQTYLLTAPQTKGLTDYVINPDNTTTQYTYDFGATEDTFTVQTADRKTYTVKDKNGNLKSVTVKREALGLPTVVLSQTTYGVPDVWGHLTRVTIAPNVYTQTTGCCGTGTTTDADGVLTTYEVDGLKRQIASTALGIKTTNALDAAGATLYRLRIGTDGSKVSLGGWVYNTAGRVVRETNAFGGTILYSRQTDANGRLVVTTTNPDLGTRIETFSRDGSLAEVAGTAVAPMRYQSGVENTVYNGPTVTLRFEKQIQVGGGNTETEWTNSYRDAAGRTVKTVSAAGATSYQYFDTLGRLVRSVDPDTVTTLYSYNTYGQLESTALDVVNAGSTPTIDFNGTDRITKVLSDATTLNSKGYVVTSTYQYVDGSSTPLLVNEARRSGDGLNSESTAFGQTSKSDTVADTATGSRTVTLTNPDNSTVVSVYSFGRLQNVTRRKPDGTQMARTSYTYDAHGRVATVTDARNGSTSFTYTVGDAVLTTSAAPGNGTAAQVTTTHFNDSGRNDNTVHPDGGTVFNDFYPTGLLQKTYGSRTYPVEYTYLPSGRMQTMKTWRSFATPSQSAITTWDYFPDSGLLKSKIYPDAATGAAGAPGAPGVEYTYTLGSRLKTRTWLRSVSGNRVLTVYKYGFDDAIPDNQHGDLTEVGYADGGVSPTVTYGYDRRGRQTTIAQGSLSTIRSFNDAGQLLGETYSGGTLGGLSVNSTYDAKLRRDTLNFKNGVNVLASTTYGYDTASRLDTVTDGTYSATYAYLANSSLIDTITFKTSGSPRLTTKRQYDKLNRLQSIVSTPSAANQALLAYGYQYNDANQRVRMTSADGSYWVYDYDTLGQVRSGKRYWNDGTPVAGQQFEYGFDDIGNRTGSKRGGDASGGNLRETTYGRNYLNQYDSFTRVNGRYADVLGMASYNQASPLAVTVNGQGAYRRGDYWRSELSLGSGAALWQHVDVAISTTTASGDLFVPPSSETPHYDLDGNLLDDGRWTYTWDAENRLVAMESLAGNPAASKRKLNFEYDAAGRRIGKKVFVWNVGSNGYPGTPNTTLRFLYDGWNLIGELDGSSAVVRSYRWGTDLSGSIQGAGGVGGLLSVKPSGGVAQFAAYDGNGNVMTLVDGTSGALSASYEYGPFGELLRSSGTQAASPVRFSSKYQDSETELLYYGYRYYNVTTGRWINSDPIQELEGGLNLHGFVDNNPISSLDILGLANYKLLFEVVKGDLVSGVWTQPKKYGSGSFGFSNNRAWGQIDVWSPQLPSLDHVCNTVNDLSLNNKANHAGEIKVYVSDLCPGKYRMTFTYEVRLWVDPGTRGGPVAHIYDQNGKVVYYKVARGIKVQANKGEPPSGLVLDVNDYAQAVVDVNIATKKKTMILKYTPTIESSNTSESRAQHAAVELTIDKIE